MNISSKNINKYNILIDLNEQSLYLIDKNKNSIVKTYSIASGKPSSPSPIGTWTIISKGKWGEGFGTRWMGLNVPWGKYGIHGTNRPSSVGSYASHGCIRMFNKDVEELYSLVGYGTTVVIYGGPFHMFLNKFRTLSPGDSGSDVFQVQRLMKNIGYYDGALDGKYGEVMKAQVIKYRKDKNLTLKHYIDKEFYNSIGIKAFE
ncbi:L,D-transpeptidase family protein [Clostridium sp. SYSU_GA19001]|uniref:L,D-transpeptidase family protein n=1 Tax=Clostridium caldaquaticum TaxID=2940653 RepID=UPI002076F469|nr:L,D-transpeptidase family protein [Clostridium caldaquaticum]MCM8711306.1 L,D-transpeptidase family protein [Clostridium caldaquaticum]